jgi:uncharacterized membrane protein YeaQ/YmgE (transglycosylase-associated protein family)
MKRILPDPVVGAMAGLSLGILSCIAFSMLGFLPDGSLFGFVVVCIVGAVAGWMVGARYERPVEQGGAVARWCAGMTALVGGVAFLAGFVGPILLTPNSPQGPMLGIFITGPLGALAGAILGIIIGFVRQKQLARR